MESKEPVCQSCGMPMEKLEDFGTNVLMQAKMKTTVALASERRFYESRPYPWSR